MRLKNADGTISLRFAFIGSVLTNKIRIVLLDTIGRPLETISFDGKKIYLLSHTGDHKFISTKEYVGDHGIVEIILSNSRDEEYEKLAEKINRLLKQPQEILVLFKYNTTKYKEDHPFFKFISRLDIEWKELEKHNSEAPGLLIAN